MMKEFGMAKIQMMPETTSIGRKKQKKEFKAEVAKPNCYVLEYTSSRTNIPEKGQPDTELVTIRNRAVVHNASKGITGVLYYFPHNNTFY